MRNLIFMNSIVLPNNERTFRKLEPADAQAMFAIEQAIIKANPEIVAKKVIHAMSMETFHERLSPGSRFTYLGCYRGDVLAGYGGYVDITNTHDLLNFDEVSLFHPLTQSFRFCALPVCSTERSIAMNAWLRVHPAYKSLGIGTGLVEERLRAAMGLRDNMPPKDYDRAKPVDLVITNVSVSNQDSIKAQLTSSVTTPVIFSAGYDISTPDYPPNIFVVHLNPRDALYRNLTFVKNIPRAQAFSSKFQDFASCLDAGHVAYFDYQNKDNMIIAVRPEWLKSQIPSPALMRALD